MKQKIKINSTPLVVHTEGGKRINFHSPTLLPKAASFLWNKHMMIHMNCRGFASAQFLQPEPAKYAHGPMLEAKTFMQPEQAYFSHHPGRFFYLKDDDSGEIFSAPYEPVKADLDDFCFSIGLNDIQWHIQHLGLKVDLCLRLAADDVLEMWTCKITNQSERKRNISLYPYFPIGYKSWMNQSASFDPNLNAVIAKSISPYQKIEDYYLNKNLKDFTYLLSDKTVNSYECAQEVFEGEGGLHNPTALQTSCLKNGEALYQTPIAAMQFSMTLNSQQSDEFLFLFGPANNVEEIAHIREKYLSKSTRTIKSLSVNNNIYIETPDKNFDNFVNHWLPRQAFYHGDINRLCTDPQTRNYLQDAMGMVYLQAKRARTALLQALSQQLADGSLPDGILIDDNAELKYINQIPHGDHCMWLPILLNAYLNETDDYTILNNTVTDKHAQTADTVFNRIDRAMQHLAAKRDHRGLSFINQGDWCDPMNMVGHQGKGVSTWLSLASAYAFSLWADICEAHNKTGLALDYRSLGDECNTTINQYCWDGDWYSRGITDNGISFGTQKDSEGKIFLNPQSWALLAKACNAQQRQKMMSAVEQHLQTPYGVMMLAPSFTEMREDIGRITQKYPGSAENGSVYNHAAIFYIYALLETAGQTSDINRSLYIDKAYQLMCAMLPGPNEDDYRQRGQVGNFIPNYYRGAFYQFPNMAGRSSQLFNTGTVAWYYRTVIEKLFGLEGSRQGLKVNPQIPSHWQDARVKRQFRGCSFEVRIQRNTTAKKTQMIVNGETLDGNTIALKTGVKTYSVQITIPQEK